MYQCPIYPLWIAGVHWIDAVPLGLGHTQYIDARDTAYETAIPQLIVSLKKTLSTHLSPRESVVLSSLITSQKGNVANLTSPGQTHPISIMPHTLLDWGDAPDVSTFFGRTEELSTLEQWIVDEQCRLIAIVGMGGIGKTSISIKLGKGGIGKTDLSLKLAQGLQKHFEYIIWRKLINAPKITDVLADLIKALSNQQDIDLPDTVDGQISRLLFYLREHHCLLILDNAEALLQGGQHAGQYREGYEGYGQLFRAVAEVTHQSSLLVTSREKPKEIAQLEGKSRPVRSLALKGLDYTDGKKIFEAVGSFSGSEEEWSELNKFYNGNPLAMELAARHIEEVFSGSISDFLHEGKQVFADLHDLLNWHFDRLPEAAKEIAFWLAINREPMALTELKADIVSPINKAKVPSTLQLLQRLFPLEKNASTFTLQPVLIEYINTILVEKFTEEVKEGEIVFFNKYALLKALAKDYVRDSQRRLHLEPVIQNLLTIFGKSDCEKRLKQLLHSLQENPPHQAGYAAGNILNLLIYLNADIRGTDFSHLPIWQAYLREAHLTDVNFAYADFTRSAFTDTFGSILSVTFSPDKKLFAAGTSAGEIRIWQATDGTPVLNSSGHTDWVWAIAFSPDGSLLASGSDDQTVRLWDIVTEKCLNILRGHTSWICSLAFNPHGTILASGSADQTVRLWDTNTGQPIKTLQGHTNCVNSVSFSPDENTLASGSHDQTVRLWEVNTGYCLTTLQGYSTSIRSIAFSPHGKLLASGDRAVHLWDIDTGQKVTTHSGHSTWIRSLAFSPNGTFLASGSDDQTIHIWKVQAPQSLYTLSGHTNRVKSIAFSYDGTWLASGSDDQTVRLWKVETGRQFRVLHGHTNRIRAVAFSPHSTLFASGSDDQTARLWNPQSDQSLYTLEGHTNRVWSIAFSPDGQHLATGSEDATIRLWDTNTGQGVHILQGHTNPVWSIAFHPKGSLLASSSEDKTIRLWEVKTGQCLHVLVGHTNPIWAIAFSSDGTILASGSHDHTIRLWDSATGENLGTLQGHDDPIWAVNFSLDGTILASGSDDGTCRLWNIQTGVCKWILKSERPYDRMNITEVKGLTEAQKTTLRILGAIEE